MTETKTEKYLRLAGMVLTLSAIIYTMTTIAGCSAPKQRTLNTTVRDF